jgi:hypothetical protein
VVSLWQNLSRRDIGCQENSAASCACRSSFDCCTTTDNGIVIKTFLFISAAALAACSGVENETKPIRKKIQNILKIIVVNY